VAIRRQRTAHDARVDAARWLRSRRLFVRRRLPILRYHAEALDALDARDDAVDKHRAMPGTPVVGRRQSLVFPRRVPSAPAGAENRASQWSVGRTKVS
jgi:hypothetical protein